MKLVFVRHAEPDYTTDSLTEKGQREARLLADHLPNTIDRPAAVYVSPLGRAQETANAVLAKTDWKAETLDFLKEFTGRCKKPSGTEEEYCWDWLPSDWVKEPLFFDALHWKDSDLLKGSNVVSAYDEVITKFDAILEKHGYRRNGHLYQAEKANNDTIVFFCHFGVSSMILSHLLNISPVAFWQGMSALTSSVTTVITEERLDGIASFRTKTYGDLSHLIAGKEEPSFLGRFCECFKNKDERH